MIDFRSCLNPTVAGLKGRYYLESEEGDNGKKLDLYKSLKSSISLKILFSSPLISNSEYSKIPTTVKDYLPPRLIPSDVLYKKRSTEAISEYKGQIRKLVDQLVNEYRDNLNLEISSDNSTKDLLIRLNKSGTYFIMKEKLKSSVVQIVREKFRQKSPFAAKTELRLFLSEVYVYLTEEMHTVINEIYNDTPKTDFEHNQLSFLKKYADEAEWNLQIENAAKYHRERIAKFDGNLNCWFDYSTFCLRNRFEDIGQEALKEILARNDKHVDALVAYAMFSFANEKHEEAQIFLQQAIKLDSENVVAICMMVRHDSS
jgi:hypothetical protein